MEQGIRCKTCGEATTLTRTHVNEQSDVVTDFWWCKLCQRATLVKFGPGIPAGWK